MSRQLIPYRWRCPICSATKAGLSTMDTVDVEVQAKYALESHVRTSNGGGHGRHEQYPPDFDIDDVLGTIEIGNDVRTDSRGATP